MFVFTAAVVGAGTMGGEIAQVIAENWMYVLGGVAGGVLVFGGIGFGIGKATG